LGVFAALQLTLMKAVPGKLFYGPVTKEGNIPVYKANGIYCYLITMALFLIGSYGLGIFSPTIVYDHFGPILASLTFFSFLFCLFLYFKGKYFPSSSDSGTTGNFLFDFYWGTELYPRIFGWDVKMFTNCRFGMMGWPVILLSFAAKQHQLFGIADSMMVAVGIQLLYISKFFLWETGYLRSLDIMHDRAGFYICWGCLVWLPCIYTSQTLYLVHHPNDLGLLASVLIFLAGSTCVMINYFADRQRQKVRRVNGNCLVWGKKPLLTLATYKTELGEKKSNVLLASGWWGMARHFHYVPEILGAFFWTLPALFDHFLPYFYVLFLTVLLVERAFRDDIRCAKKYGEDWERHCEKVPYKIIPYVF